MMKTKIWSKPYTKNRTFLRTMIVSIVSMICIPLLLLQVVMILQSADSLENYNADVYLSALRMNSESFESQVDLLSYNAIKIAMDSTVNQPIHLDASDYSIKQAADAIKNYGLGMPLSATVGVYYRTSGNLLYNGARKDIDTFCDSIGVTAQRKTELLSILNQTEKLSFFATNQKGTEYLLITKGVRMNSIVQCDSVVLYVIKADNLLDIHQASLPAKTAFAICKPGGELLISNKDFPHDLINNSDYQKYLEDPTQSLYEVKTEGGNKKIFKYSDAVNDKIYLAVVSKDVAQESTMVYLRRAGTILLVSCVALVGLLMATVRINYRPIAQMASKYSIDEENNLLSELERIDLAFSSKNQEYADQRDILASLVLGELVYGGETNHKLINDVFGQNRYSFCAVATVVAPQILTNQVNSALVQIRNKIQDVEVFSTSVPSRPHVLFIFLAKNKETLVTIQAVVPQVIHAAAGKEYAVHMGPIVENLEDIQKSYYDSLTAGSQGGENGTDRMVMQYPASDVQRFLQCVCLGDVAQAQSTLEVIEHQLSTQSISFARRRFAYYKFLTEYLNVIKENVGPVPNDVVDKLLDFRYPTRTFNLIRDTVEKYCAKMVHKEQQSNAQHQIELLAWVNEHLTDYDLCLASAADALNMSVYAVSRLFKEQVGEGFKEYVVEKRMEMAYTLLRTTDKGVSEIGKMVGFENATYFSSVFKKQFGTSPSKVRADQESTGQISV